MKLKNKKMFLKFFLLVAVLALGFFAFSSEVWAATRYVDNTTTNCSTPSDNDFDPATDTCGAGSYAVYNTIQGAVDVAQAGDTVSVAAGEYNESVIAKRSGIAGSPITIQGELDGSGNQLTFINPGTTLSSWELVSNGVYKAVYTGGDIGSAIFEIDGETYDIPILCSTSLCSWSKAWSNLTTDASAQYNKRVDSLICFEDADWWDGIEALAVQYKGYVYIRIRSGVAPSTVGTVRVTLEDATINLGSHSYITIKDLKIKASAYGVQVNGGNNNIIDNNIIINGKKKIDILGNSSTITASNNTLFSKSYSTFVEGSTTGYGVWPYAYIPKTQMPDGPSCGRNWAVSAAEMSAGAIKRHGYQFAKYETNDSSSTCRDDCGISVAAADGVTITGNHIYETDDGVLLNTNTDNITISDNTIHDLHGNAMMIGNSGGTSNGTVKIYNNSVGDSEFGIRFGSWEKESIVGYVYNNKFWQPGNLGGHIMWHFYQEGSAPSGTRDLWLYHNSFADGTELFNINSFISPSNLSAMNTIQMVNNTASTLQIGVWTDNPPIGLCSNNYFGFSGYSIYGGVSFCSNSINFESASIFPLWHGQTDFPIYTLPVGSTAVEGGIDISKPFTIDGKTYPALPGFSSNPKYFTGINPDIGAVQSGGADTTPPAIPSGVSVQ